MARYDQLKIKLFMDGANVESMRTAVATMPHISGFTTNPTLMRKAGITDYTAFAKEVIAAVKGMPMRLNRNKTISRAMPGCVRDNPESSSMVSTGFSGVLR